MMTNIAAADADVPDSPADAPVPEEGGHYYDVDDSDRQLMACIGVLDDGRAVLGTGGTMRIVDASKLARVPSTAGEMLRVVALVEAQLTEIEATGTALSERAARAEKKDGETDVESIDTATIRRLLTAIDVWVRGIPGIPDSEK